MHDPSAVALAGISVLFVIFALLAFRLWLLQGRPLSATDLYCAAVDEQLDAEEREARRVIVAGGGFRVEHRAPPSLRVLGETADGIWPDVKA
jgi:hypothetical protein